MAAATYAIFKGEQLVKEVDKQPWDPSVKALVEFPSVLANMGQELSWTSCLAMLTSTSSRT